MRCGPPRGYSAVSARRACRGPCARGHGRLISLHPIIYLSSTSLPTRDEGPLLRCSVVAQLRQCTGVRERVPGRTSTRTCFSTESEYQVGLLLLLVSRQTSHFLRSASRALRDQVVVSPLRSSALASLDLLASIRVSSLLAVATVGDIYGARSTL